MKTRITLVPASGEKKVEVEADDQGDVLLRLKDTKTYEAALTRQEVGRLIDVLQVAVKPPRLEA